MKYLELTEQKAKDLNEICLFGVEIAFKNESQSKNFGITHFNQQKPHFEIDYLRHLLDVAKQYPDISKILQIEGVKNISVTHNTKEFLKSGGFIRILKIEQREDKIQDYTIRNLRQSVFATKSWWIFFAFTTIVAIAVAIITSIITTLSNDKLSKKKLQPTTTQDSLLQSLTTYILLQQDSSRNHQKNIFYLSYLDSLKKSKKK